MGYQTVDNKNSCLFSGAIQALYSPNVLINKKLYDMYDSGIHYKTLYDLPNNRKKA